jgi:hypothetical protein
MNNRNLARIGCLGLGDMANRVMSSEASTHLGNACREVLLAMRSAVDAVIEGREQKAEAKVQKVEITEGGG